MYYIFLIMVTKAINMAFHNDTVSPIIVIQPNVEQYPINLFGEYSKLPNTTYVYTGQSFPSEEGLIITSTNFINISAYTSFNQKFCPIFDWAPYYQPVHFYLSPTTIDLVIFESNYSIQIIDQIITQDLTKINENLICFSIIPIEQQQAFMVDCDIVNKQANKTQKVLLYYNLEIEPTTLIISNFSFIESYFYQYNNNDYEEYINQCLIRVTITFDFLINSVNLYENCFIQYCPYQENDNKVNYTQFFIIYDYTYNSQSNTYLLDSQSANSKNISNDQEIYQLEEIIINQFVFGYKYDSWNLGFLFKFQEKIYKCQFSLNISQQMEWTCMYTVLQNFQPNSVRVTQYIDQNLILISANNAAIYTVYLFDEDLNDNYHNVFYKDIYQEGYYFVDVSVTQGFVSVIMSDNPSNYSQIKKYMCINNQIQPDTLSNNILKIYSMDKSNATYYERYVPPYATFLQNFNYADFGNYFIYYTSFNQSENIFLAQVFDKQLRVKYFTKKEVTPYYPIIANITVSTYLNETISQFNKYLVICLAPSNYVLPQLVAQSIRLNESNLNEFNLTRCPASNDSKIYQLTTNQINMLEGVQGPLLQFNYAANPSNPFYYPTYLNFQYKIKSQKQSPIQNIFRVYDARSQDIFQKDNVFGSVIMIVSYQDKPNVVYKVICDIISDESNQIQISDIASNLKLEDCQNNLLFELSNFQQVDYFRSLEDYYFAAQFSNSQQLYHKLYNFRFALCQKEQNQPCSTVEYQETLNNQTIIQLEIEFPIFYGNFAYYKLTVLYNNTDNLLFLFINQTLSENLISLHAFTTLNYEDTIVSFKYAYLNSQTSLFILFQSGYLQLNRVGVLTNLSAPIFKNYSKVVDTITLNDYLEMTTDTKIDFNIADLIFEDIHIISINIYFAGPQSSLILQFYTDNLLLIHFWREIPIYNQLISKKLSVFISGSSLYVPIESAFLGQQTYYVYNLQDYSSRMLIGSFFVRTTINDPNLLITAPIKNIHSLPFINTDVSMTLVLGYDDYFLYYLNQGANFVFNLRQQQLINENSTLQKDLVIQVESANKIILYRNYSIYFNFNRSQITTVKNLIKLKATPNNTQKKGENYLFLLLFDQTVFLGPIENYICYSNNPNVVIYPTPYLQTNKYMGEYMETISQFGLVKQIMSLDNPIYYSLFYQNSIENIQSYKDLVIVLTSNYILFYQDHQNKSNFTYQSCGYIDYNVTTDGSNQTCSIRLIDYHYLAYLENTKVDCKMQLNQINQVMILCQTFKKKSVPHSIQVIDLIHYTYQQDINAIFIIPHQLTLPQYCYCFLLDIQPFLYNQIVYQVARYTYMDTNSYFTIYQLDFKSTPRLNTILIIPQDNQYPLKQSKDYTLVIENNSSILQIIFLQPYSIEMITIDMSTLTVGPIQQLKLIAQDIHQQIQFQSQTMEFISSLNMTNPSDPFYLIVGNANIVYEIILIFTLNTFTISYTFEQYVLCEHTFLEKPQFVHFNYGVQYLVTMCLTKAFAYTYVEQEIEYIFGQPTSNQVYIQLFSKNNATSSYPVYIIENSLVNPQTLHFNKFAIYQIPVSENQTDSRLLLSNSTFFMIDYDIFSYQGFYIVYPIELAANDSPFINVYVEAYNSYSQNSTQFEIEFPYNKNEFHSTIWFYILVALFVGILIFILIYLLACRLRRDKKIEKLQQSMNSSQAHSSQGIEMEQNFQQQRKPSELVLLDKAIMSVFQSNKKTQ